MNPAGFTHLDAAGAARMVDVGAKAPTRRLALAGGVVTMREETLDAVVAGSVSKGEVLAVARVAGIQAAKRTGELIPLCHPLGLDSIQVAFERAGPTQLAVFAAARLTAKTGVEMEALTAVSVAGLTVYDMCKAVDKRMVLGGVRLLLKVGGKSAFCELSGRVRGGGVAPPDGWVDLGPAPREPEAPGRAWAQTPGIPVALLPEDCWLVAEGGARGLIDPAGRWRLEDPDAMIPSDEPAAVRLGASWDAGADAGAG